MSSGGHGRSGPAKDPNSLKSARIGFAQRVLPGEGYRGTVPEFPLPEVSERELQVWRQSWRLPQATVWAEEPWRHQLVAMWVRWSVRMEAADCPAALGNVVMRLADQVGMTPAGLREQGWRIGEAESPRPVSAPKAAVGKPPSSRDRFKVIDGGAAA